MTGVLGLNQLAYWEEAEIGKEEKSCGGKQGPNYQQLRILEVWSMQATGRPEKQKDRVKSGRAWGWEKKEHRE